jgi:hypothetical protein|tara:strand:- start:935 stop:1426 length:492 start_codon:yes stop_codon:yes gene_type:complete
MRKEFNELEKELNSYIVYCNERILQKLENLNKKIVEVEKRLVCVDRIATQTVETISKYTEKVDNGYKLYMDVKDHDAIQRGAFDIQIAVDLNDTEPIENNWYELFQTETDVVLKGIEKIESDEELTKKFRTRYATEFPMIKACVKADMLKKETINFIKELTKI